MSEDENFIILLHRIDQMLQKMELIERMLMQQTLHNKEVLNSKEAAAYMGRSVSGIYKLRRKYKLPGSRPNGGRLYFNRKELYGWMMAGAQLQSQSQSQSQSQLQSQSQSQLQSQSQSQSQVKSQVKVEEEARMAILNQEGD